MKKHNDRGLEVPTGWWSKIYIKMYIKNLSKSIWKKKDWLFLPSIMCKWTEVWSSHRRFRIPQPSFWTRSTPSTPKAFSARFYKLEFFWLFHRLILIASYFTYQICKFNNQLKLLIFILNTPTSWLTLLLVLGKSRVKQNSCQPS